MFERRLRIVYVLALLWFAVLGARLFMMQVLDAEEWRQKSKDLSRSRVRLAARRGEILDRHGAILAGDRLERDLMVSFDRFGGSSWICDHCGCPATSTTEEAPRRCGECRRREFLPGPPRDLTGLPDRLGMTRDEFRRALNAAGEVRDRAVDQEVARLKRREIRRDRDRIAADLSAWPWVLASNVPADVVKEVSLHPVRYRGLSIRSTWRRARVGGPHVREVVGGLGDVQREEVPGLLEKGYNWSEIYRMQVGRTGLEKTLQDRLASSSGHRIVDRDPRGGAPKILEEVPARDGETIRTSLDLRLQNHIAEYLAVQAKAREAQGAFFTALDPTTGEVIVFAGWSRRENGANLFHGPTVPGSVFKVVTAIAGVETWARDGAESGDPKYDPAAGFDCDRQWHGIGCHHGAQNGLDLSEALAISCNGYFGHAADLIGIDILSLWARCLGFGEPTGLEITREPAGLVPDPAWKAKRFERDRQRRSTDETFRGGLKTGAWHRGETWQVGFGQGALLVTPIQVARLLGIVANGGHLVEPTLLAGGSGRGPRIVGADTLARVRKGLEGAVDHGTAAGKGLDRYRVAGKTGTGDLSGKLKNVAWFAGYAPREAPRVAFACCFVDVKGYGGSVAGPVCVEFLREFMKE